MSDSPIDLDGVPSRARYTLEQLGTWEAVARLRRSEFIKRRGIGHKTATQVAEILAANGMSFATDPCEKAVVNRARLRPSDDEINRRARFIIATALEPLVKDLFEKAQQDPEASRVGYALTRLLRIFR